MAKGRKTGGRKAGSVNLRASKGPGFVEQVRDRLKSEKKLTFEQLSVSLLTCGIPGVVQKELQNLREYEYGKPMSSVEHSGKEGGPIPVTIISYVGRPIR